jgi:N6-adenosine-specific RNA methylase IME4
MVAAKLATLKLGDNQHSEGLPIGRGSELLNVGERTVARAREVQEHGTPELVHAVERGAVSVSAAADVATLSAQEQREIVARGEREILRAAQDIRARKAEIRRAERIERLAATCNHSTPFPSDRRYAVLYADPPWHFEVYNEESGIERAAGNHYSTMSLDEICALPVPRLASPDAALFMWTTVPHLRESFDVLVAWGFEYKTNIVWVKDKIGLGYFVRNQHELLLVATRGDMPLPSPGNRPSSVIDAPRREHSRKPDEAYELIERMYSELPKLELFARQARPGWDAWGNETGKFAAAN